HRHVVVALLLVELEAVLEPGAAPALNVHAQLERRIVFAGDQLADLGRRGGSEIDRTLQGLVAGVAFGKTNDIHALRMGPCRARFKRPDWNGPSRRPTGTTAPPRCHAPVPRAR